MDIPLNMSKLRNAQHLWLEMREEGSKSLQWDGISLKLVCLYFTKIDLNALGLVHSKH